MNPQQAYKLFSQALTAANSVRTLIRSSSAILKTFQPKNVGKTKNKESSVQKSNDKKSDDKKQDQSCHIKTDQLNGALTNMGFSKEEARNTIQVLINKNDFNSCSLSYLLKEALVLLYK